MSFLRRRFFGDQLLIPIRTRGPIPLPSTKPSNPDDDNAEVPKLDCPRQNKPPWVEDESHNKKSDKAIDAYLEKLRAELEHAKIRAISAEEKARRQQELHEAESLSKAKINRRLLQENKALLEQPKHNLGFQSMDDSTCENLIHDLFHLLKTWCFSNFQDNASSVSRLQIQTEIGTLLVEEILSPLIMGHDHNLQCFLLALNDCVARSATPESAHQWRLITSCAEPLLLGDLDIVTYWFRKIETQFGGIARAEKAETRARTLRTLIQKAIALHKKLHEQQARYLVHWIIPGTPFSSEFMQVEGAADSGQRCPVAVEYCLQPLVQKIVGDHEPNFDPLVIMRAVVIVKE